MELFEKVEKIVEKTGVSYEDAKKALEESGGDILDAVIALERQGKIADGKAAYYQTSQSRSSAGPKEEEVLKAEFVGGPKQENKAKGAAKDFWESVKDLLRKAIECKFEVSRRGDEILSLPVLVLILLLLIVPPLSIFLLIVGLFFGCRYSFSGSSRTAANVNSAFEKAAAVADDIKEDFRSEAK